MATQEQLLLRTRESQLEEKIKLLEKMRSDLEAKGKPKAKGEIAMYRAITFTKYIKEEEEETLLFRIQFMCDSQEWNKVA